MRRRPDKAACCPAICACCVELDVSHHDWVKNSRMGRIWSSDIKTGA
jgi:hypothetical protein